VPSSVADLAALGKLFEENRPRLLSMLQRRIDDSLAARIDPDDVLNEAFLDARSKYPRFKEQASMTPYAWLYRIVLDTLIRLWRQHNRLGRDVHREMPFPERSSLQLGLGLIQRRASPSSAAANAEVQRAVRQTVELLKEKDRQLLWMRHQDGLSYAEIASVLDVTDNAAMVRYTRALKRFKELWHRLFPESKN